MGVIMVEAKEYKKKMIKLVALETALTNLLEVCKCSNNCKKDDKTCASRMAEKALKL